MYWEEVYEHYEYACNLNVLERNEEMHFQFLLHAQTKEAANSWQDATIPYPDRNWKPPKARSNLPTDPMFNRSVKRVKASPEAQKRFKEVLERMRQGQEEQKAAERAYYGR